MRKETYRSIEEKNRSGKRLNIYGNLVYGTGNILGHFEKIRLFHNVLVQLAS